MGTFTDALKKWFYTNSSHAIGSGIRRLCLLDANGNPIGSDTLTNIGKLVAIDSSKYVDMGLSSGTLWAKCNLGGNVETDYGWYFSWGNPDAHPQGGGYDFSQATYNATPAASIDGNLTMAQDAASVLLGGKWRMPTKEQFAELFNTTYIDYIDFDGNVITGTDKRTTINNVVGLYVRSKSNGNTLFFPATGYYDGTTLQSNNSDGNYWALSLYSGSNVYFLNINSSGVSPNEYDARYYGYPIRPVINK